MAKPQQNAVYPVNTDDITAKGRRYDITLDTQTLDMLAQRFGVTAIRDFKAEVAARRLDDGCTVVIEGTVRAQVEQPCVVTLEPVVEMVEEGFEAHFLDEERVSSFAKALREKQDKDEDTLKERQMPESHEEPEAIVGGMIDIGDLAAQYLSLAIDPYPHTAEAKRRDVTQPVHKDPEVSVFAVLKDHPLKKGGE